MIFCSCSAKKTIITTTSEAINKPYLTLSGSCELSPDGLAVICEPEGFRKAITESTDRERSLRKLRAELDAREAHSRVDDWFHKGQMAKKQQEIDRQKLMKWIFGGGGILTGAVTAVVLIFAIN